MEITPLGDSALLIRVAENFDDAPTDVLNKVLATKHALEAAQIPGVVEVAPAYTTVALFVIRSARSTQGPWSKMFLDGLSNGFS